MVEKSDDLYLNHINDACKQILQYTKGVSREKFESTKLLQDRVIKELEIIGEATRNISAKTRAENKNINWKKIVGMRDKLIHDHTGVDLDIVWKTATVDVPKLLKEIKVIL